ncbi:MAG: hypothetical protein KDM64_13590 [Verrucomicrobiae bacterium]|nr:hypothetical protein [Verrucomicrobiae bacterium]
MKLEALRQAMNWRKIGVVMPLCGVFAFAGDAGADAPSVYGEGPDTGEVPPPTHHIHLKDGRISIANAVDKRLLIFDSKTGRATVVDHRAKQVSDFDDDGIRRLTARIIETQRQVLAEIEGKLSKLPKEERDALRETVDMLHEINQSPEKLNAPTYRYEGAGKSETLLGVKAEEATLLKGDKPVATALLATREASGIPESEFAALNGLQRRFDQLAKVLPPHLQSWLGAQGMLSVDGMLALRVLPMEDLEVGGGRRLELLRIDHEPIEEGWFSIPDSYEKISLERLVEPQKEVPNSENVSEK